jgi:hypothetical protein
MQSLLWSLTQQASKILEDPSERESFLGDIEERNLAGTLRGLADISCLIASRQLKLWQNWRPWLTLLVLFLPLSTLLHSALSISSTLANNPFYESQYVQSVLIWGSISTMLWAWSVGFSMAQLGKHTVWTQFPALALVSHIPMALSRSPYLFLFGFASWMFLVALPSVMGARACFQNSRLSTKGKLALAIPAMIALYFLVMNVSSNRPNLHPMDMIMATLATWPIAVPLTSRSR